MPSRRVAGSLRATRRSTERRPAAPEGAARPRSCVAVLVEDFLFLDRAIGLVDPNHQGEPERQRRHANHDGGEDQNVRQRIRINRECRIDDRRGAADDLSRLDVQKINRSLENGEADQLLHHVAARNHDVEARHHQEDGDDVVVVLREIGERCHQRPRSTNA